VHEGRTFGFVDGCLKLIVRWRNGWTLKGHEKDIEGRDNIFDDMYGEWTNTNEFKGMDSMCDEIKETCRK